MQTSRISQFLFTAVVLLGLIMIIAHLAQKPAERISASEVYSYVENGFVKKISFNKATGEAQGTFLRIPDGVEAESFVFSYDSNANEQLTGLLYSKGVEYDYTNPGFWESLISPQTILLLILFALPIVFFIWLMNRQMQNSGNNQAMNFGKSRARLASDGKRRVTFAEVAGVDEAVTELHEIVDFLRDPKKYEALGAEIPKGVMLVGPPGCGKTHLAKAVAGEANVPFFYISGSDFVEMFVGVGASRVRDLFDQAKRRAPCLVFIDELDAVGRHRGTGIGGTHDEREQTLNQLLVEMDGFEPNSGIIVIAATNRPDVLDPALLRPGRFDRRVVVDAPDLGGRRAILDIYARNKPLAPDANLDQLAQRTPGFSGADLKNVLNEAALLAARMGRSKVAGDDLFEAVDRVVAGPERKSRIINSHEKQVIAYHELGHAIVSHALLHTDPVHKISILPRGQALGYTLNFPMQDRFLMSKQQLLDRVSMTLGGRAAEEIVFGDITTGASNDLQRSTEMVRDMVTKYGMSEVLGPIQFGNQHENPFLGRSMMEDRNYSEEIASRIDGEVRRIVTYCYERAKDVLMKLRGKMDMLAETLIDKEYIERDEFEALMADAKYETDANSPEYPFNVSPQPGSKGGPTILPAPAG